MFNRNILYYVVNRNISKRHQTFYLLPNAESFDILILIKMHPVLKFMTNLINNKFVKFRVQKKKFGFTE